MLFDTLADYFEKISATGERVVLYKLIGELLDRANASELPKIAYLFEARLAPAFATMQLEMGERLVAESVAIATNKTVRQVNRAYKLVGDLGLVADKLLPPKSSRLTDSQPDRLDLTDTLVKAANEAGALFAINSDAHSLSQLEYIRYGIFDARRGWTEARSVINSWTWSKLSRWLGKRRSS